MFLLLSVRHVGAHPGEHQHCVSIQISINLGKTWVALGKFLGEFVYLAVEICHRWTLLSATPSFVYVYENIRIRIRKYSYIRIRKHSADLNLGEDLCICTPFHFPDSGHYLLNGFDFFDLFWMAWHWKPAIQFIENNHPRKNFQRKKILSPVILSKFPVSAPSFKG